MSTPKKAERIQFKAGTVHTLSWPFFIRYLFTDKGGEISGGTFIFAHLQKLKQITDLQLLTYFEKSLGSVIWFIFLKMGQKSNYLLRFPLIL